MLYGQVVSGSHTHCMVVWSSGIWFSYTYIVWLHGQVVSDSHTRTLYGCMVKFYLVLIHIVRLYGQVLSGSHTHCTVVCPISVFSGTEQCKDPLIVVLHQGCPVLLIA